MKGKKLKQELIVGCVLFGILILLGTLQVIFSPFLFVRAVSIIGVIGCSICVGAFFRQLFILKIDREV